MIKATDFDDAQVKECELIITYGPIYNDTYNPNISKSDDYDSSQYQSIIDKIKDEKNSTFRRKMIANNFWWSVKYEASRSTLKPEAIEIE